MNSKCFTLHLNCRSIFSEGLLHKKIRHVISDTAKRSLCGILILVLRIKKTNLHTIMTCQSQFGALLSYQEFIFLFILALRAGEKGNTWVLLFFISFHLAGFEIKGSEGHLALSLLAVWESPATFLVWLEKLCLSGQEFDVSWYLTQIFPPLWQRIRASHMGRKDTSPEWPTVNGFLQGPEVFRVEETNTHLCTCPSATLHCRVARTILPFLSQKAFEQTPQEGICTGLLQGGC